MNTFPALRRWFAAGLTAALLVVLLCVLIWNGPGSSVSGAGASTASENKTKGGPLWSMFGGSIDRNMVNDVDHNIPREWGVKKGEEKHLKWEARLGSRAYGGPIIADGKIFIGTNNGAPRDPKIKGDKGVLMCFRESDGKFLWQAVTDKLPSGLVNDWPQEGVCSTPIVEGKRLYYVSNRCEVVCLDTEGFLDGKNDGVQDEKYKGEHDADIIWHYDMMGELNVFPHNLAACSPVIYGDNLFIITANGVDEQHLNIPSPKAPSFIVLNKNTGKLLWQNNSPSEKLVAAGKEGASESAIKTLQNRGEIIMHGQWSNPTVAVVNGKPQVVFPGGDGWLRAFEPETGKLIWKFDANPKDSKYDLGGKGTRNDFIATPVIVDNRLYIGTGQDPEHYDGVGRLWCIDITKTGDISPHTIEGWDGDTPKGVKPNPNSSVIWQYGGPAPEGADRDFIFGRTMSTCCVHDGLVYAAELSGYIHCLDANTGKPLWVHDLKSAIWGSPYFVDGTVMIGTEDGDVYVFKHGREKELIAKNEMERGVKSTPVACKGVLYIMTETNLYAIQKK